MGPQGPEGLPGPLPVVSAGGGLQGDGSAGAPLAVSFAGSGSAVSAARSDHGHTGYVAEGDPRLSDARPPLPGSASYLQNQTAAAQPASFHIGGSAVVDGAVVVGGAAPSAPLAVKGADAAGGSGSISTTNSTTTTVNGAATAFTTEVRAGDILVAAGQRRIVTSVTGAGALSVDRPFRPQLIGGTTYEIESPVARFTRNNDGAAAIVDGDGHLVAPEVRVNGYSRRDDLRLLRYHATCQSLAGGSYNNVAAVSPGQAANVLTGGARLTGSQVCAAYVGNNSITNWTCLAVPYVYEYNRTSAGYVGTDVRPTWSSCGAQFPDVVGSYHWLEPGDTGTVMMACCVRN